MKVRLRCRLMFGASGIKLGTEMKDGSVFAGVTSDCKQILAMPVDLGLILTFNDAVRAVKMFNTSVRCDAGSFKNMAGESLKGHLTYK